MSSHPDDLPALLREIVADDFEVPADRRLNDLTGALGRALGDPDPVLRDELALPVLATWIERGVYDDLLVGLGDGLASGLRTGLGEDGTATVFGRSFRALVLAECIARDTEAHLVPDGTVMVWGDQLITWFLGERDLRGWVPGHGWAHALAHGADALGVLAASPHLGADELGLVLEVLLRRVAAPTGRRLGAGEPDRLAAALVAVLRRDLVALDRVASALAPVTIAATVREDPDRPDTDPYADADTAQGFLRALYLQLAIGPAPPPSRADVVLLVVDALRASNPHHLLPRVEEAP